MIVKTKKGTFQLDKNFRDAFNVEAFEEKYIEECMDKFAFVVGDISSNILRLKGFDLDPKSKNYYGFIEDYLEVSCPIGCPYFVLRRVNGDTTKEEPLYMDLPDVRITPLVKENFDKESLVLKSCPKVKPHIVIDMERVNAIPKGTLSDDLVEYIKQDKQNSNSKNQNQSVSKSAQTTYVSASPDFDPNKVQNFNKHKNNHQKNNKKNKNNKVK